MCARSRRSSWRRSSAPRRWSWSTRCRAPRRRRSRRTCCATSWPSPTSSSSRCGDFEPGVNVPPMRQLLSDVTVLELASDPAGSYCGKVFADLGADVVKVETPDGDPAREHPERYQHLNTNKRAVRIAADGTGQAQLLDLVAGADVVVESKDAGDLAGFGLARDDVRAQFPA